MLITGWEVRIWSLQFCSVGKLTFPYLWPNNRCIPFENTLGRSAVVFCACENLQSLFVVFFLVRAVHKSGFRLARNETLNKRKPLEWVMQLQHLFSCRCDDHTAITPVVIFRSLRRSEISHCRNSGLLKLHSICIVVPWVGVCPLICLVSVCYVLSVYNSDKTLVVTV